MMTSEHALGRTRRGTKIDDHVFKRFAARMSYMSGDFDDRATYERVKAAIGGARVPMTRVC